MYNINSYLIASESVTNLLATDPKFVRLKKNTNKLVATPNIINWGCHKLPNLDPLVDYKWANHPLVTSYFSDKVRMHWLSDISPELKENCIETTVSKQEALSWLNAGMSVVCRTLTRASNGRGAYIVDPQMGNAEALLEQDAEGKKVRLWSKYFKKIAEYRMHVGLLPDNEFRVIAVQEKRKRTAYDGDTRLRNSDGFVFRSRDVEGIPANVSTAAETALKAIKSVIPYTAFAGIDIAYNRHYDKARIIEFNSAPGIGENDAAAYHTFFQEYFGE